LITNYLSLFHRNLQTIYIAFVRNETGTYIVIFSKLFIH